ncbi:MAG: hypothetical protein R6U63_10645 [Longimicrobiales bacterium]
MKGLRRAAIGFGGAILLAGCGSGPGASGAWQAVTDTVADTVVVRTVAGSVWGDTTRLVEELRIGSLEGADAYVLGNPVSIAVGNGMVYVLDAQVPVVRAYDAGTGEHVMDIGRDGGGPGEYRHPDGLAVLPDGRVLVRSPRGLAINVYAPDGEFLEAWPHPAPGFHTYDRFHVDTAGASYATGILSGGVPWEWERGFIGVSASGQVTDTIAINGWLAYERADLTAFREGSSSRRQVPFTGEYVWSFSPHGYLIAGVTSRYAVYLFRPDGVLRIEREVASVPVQPEEAEERRARLTADLRRQYGSWRWNGPPIPETKPPFRRLFADHDGRIWVVMSQPGRPVLSAAEAAAQEARSGRPVLRYREPPAFDVFDRDGRFLGPVVVPAGLVTEGPNPVARGDTVWGVERDPLGVPTIVRYRLAHGVD